MLPKLDGHAAMACTLKQEDRPMKLPQSSRDPRRLGTVWFVVPALWAAAALAGYVILSSSPALRADSLPAQAGMPTGALSLVPEAASVHSFPDASTVFKDRSYPVSEHVEAF
jgi:hypothetical protein